MKPVITQTPCIYDLVYLDKTYQKKKNRIYNITSMGFYYIQLRIQNIVN